MPHTPPKTILTTRGYGIRKDTLDSKKLNSLRKSLMVRPFVPPSAPVKPEAFPVYVESPKRIWVPRVWGIKEFGEPEKTRLDEGVDCSKGLTFNGDLRPHQKDLLKDWVSKVIPSSNPEGRILTVPCGYGKTVMSLWCASQVGKKTMVVVHKEFLMNQFRDEIKRFLPHAKVGRIQGDVVDVDGKDIVLVMLQSLVIRGYPSEVFDGFGMVIFDECHHLAAEVFSRALLMLGFWRMLGLSATPKRKDNLSKVFHWHIGDFLAKIESRKKEHVNVTAIHHHVSTSDVEYLTEPKTMTDHVCLPKLITKVAEREERSAMIAEVVVSLIQKEPRQVLILADRKSLLSWFYDTFTSSKFHNGILVDEVGYYVGGMKADALELSATKKVVLGTFAMASEGMNIPSLNTLILATSKSDIIQSIGRHT
jgi:superfamily II DNA or RNA helicase